MEEYLQYIESFLRVFIILSLPTIIWAILRKGKYAEPSSNNLEFEYRISFLSISLLSIQLLVGVCAILMGVMWGALIVLLPFGIFFIFLGIYTISHIRKSYIRITENSFIYFDGKNFFEEPLSRLTGFYEKGWVVRLKFSGREKPIVIPLLLFQQPFLILRKLKDEI